MTVGDLATYLQKSREWVRGHAVELGGIKLGNSWRFDQTGVQRYLERQRVRDPWERTPRSQAIWEGKRLRERGW